MLINWAKGSRILFLFLGLLNFSLVLLLMFTFLLQHSFKTKKLLEWTHCWYFCFDYHLLRNYPALLLFLIRKWGLDVFEWLKTNSAIDSSGECMEKRAQNSLELRALDGEQVSAEQ